MNRRRFVGVLLGGLAGVAGLVWSVRGRRPQREEQRASLPAQSRRTLEALCEALLPAHAGFPGAVEAGAMRYMERELGAPKMRGTRERLVLGAAVLDRRSGQRFARAFAALGADEREVVLTDVVAGTGVPSGFDGRGFVELALALVLEGVFGDPVHGGNTGEAGWRWARFSMGGPRCLEHCE